ncbi:MULTISPECIES: CD3072 family TudS-related putative desulfidase [Oscillospiraceae]|uniref:CD3072 family TudS-related putative desulfidase n=1 Tax=Clostridia TaxID=186801 RepID=UPI0011066783|nr:MULTISPECIES: CD3072 family TudS-related putative desulfidase [Oscillospiraceae]
MFTDGRSKKVIFIAHCLLNQNAISDGTAVYPAAFQELIQRLLEQDVGIVQMPCPELCCLGLDRGDPAGAARPVVEENTRIRGEMEKAETHTRLMSLVEQVMWQITEYRRHGFKILGIIGANRSPNCGVDTTSDHNAETPGRGRFMEELHKRLQAAGMELPMVGLKASDCLEDKLSTLFPIEK